MDIKKVKDFKEGDHVNVNLLISSLTRGITNSGAPYLTLTLQDSTKSIDAKLWDVKSEVEKELQVGKVFNFDLEINLYRNNLQAKVIKVFPLNQAELDMSDYIFNSPIPKDDLRNSIAEGINQINNEKIAMIVNGLLNYYENDVYEYPAAARIHHNFIGGLATHIAGMLKVGCALCEIYPSISKDYLLAGIILHDLGKIEELTSPVVTEYSVSGRLLGHISIMDARILEVAKELKLDESEEVMLLRHMVLSHHGKYEFGSPILPETLEAELLTYIDNIDAKIAIIDKALAEVKEGEFTPKLFAMDNRTFYRHK
ncbi:MAG: HD domain-containing protein [Erysipelotrichaceae bacterium]|nr:HD domain-containing protein [Erysipelotrichaceae bacterium]